HRLMIVVRDGEVLRQFAEVGGVAMAHAVEAHGDAALVGARKGIVALTRAFTGSEADPGKQILFSTVDLLPHLEKAMHGIAHRGGVWRVARDPERPVRKIRRKAAVERVVREVLGIISAGLRQNGEGCAGGRRNRITIANSGLALRGFGKPRARAAVLVYDSTREQVGDRLTGGRLVGREQI